MSLSPLEALIKPLLNDIWLFNITKVRQAELPQLLHGCTE